jgi:glycogen synthase
MPELYAQHDIFVLPSFVEGMPLVLLEAMASGLAVVTTESSGMTDLVEDDHDGLLTISGDSDSLTASALRHEAVFRRAMGVKQVPTVPESQEITTDGASYSGKVVLN